MIKFEFSAQVILIIPGVREYELCLEYLHQYDLTVSFKGRQLPLSRYNIYENKIIFLDDISEFENEIINIERHTPADIDYEQEGGNIEAHAMEKALDRITLILQEARRIVCVVESGDKLDGLCPADIERYDNSASLNWDLSELEKRRTVTRYDARLGFFFGDNSLAEKRDVMSGFSFSNPKIVIYTRTADERPVFEPKQIQLQKDFTLSLPPASTGLVINVGKLPSPSDPSWNNGGYYANSKFISSISEDIGSINSKTFTFGGNQYEIVAIIHDDTNLRIVTNKKIIDETGNHEININTFPINFNGATPTDLFNISNYPDTGYFELTPIPELSGIARAYNYTIASQSKALGAVWNLNVAGLEIPSTGGELSETINLPTITVGQNSEVLPQAFSNKFTMHKAYAKFIRGFIVSDYVDLINEDIGNSSVVGFTYNSIKVFIVAAFTGNATKEERLATLSVSPNNNLGHFAIIAVPKSLNKIKTSSFLNYVGFVKNVEDEATRHVDRSDLQMTINYPTSEEVTINGVVCDVGYVEGLTTSKDNINFYLGRNDELGFTASHSRLTRYDLTIEVLPNLGTLESQLPTGFFTYEDPDNPASGRLWRWVVDYNSTTGLISNITGPVEILNNSTKIWYSLIVSFDRGNPITFSMPYNQAGVKVDGSRGRCTVDALTAPTELTSFFYEVPFKDGVPRNRIREEKEKFIEEIRTGIPGPKEPEVPREPLPEDDNGNVDSSYDTFLRNFRIRLLSLPITSINGNRPVYHSGYVDRSGNILYELWGCKTGDEGFCPLVSPEFAILWHWRFSKERVYNILLSIGEATGQIRETYNERGYHSRILVPDSNGSRFVGGIGKNTPIPNGIFKGEIDGKTVFYEVTRFAIYQRVRDVSGTGGEIRYGDKEYADTFFNNADSNRKYYLYFTVTHSSFEGVQSDRSVSVQKIAENLFKGDPQVRSYLFFGTTGGRSFEIEDQNIISHFQDENYDLFDGAGFYDPSVFKHEYTEKVNSRDSLAALIVNEESQVSEDMCPAPDPGVGSNINGSTEAASRIAYAVVSDDTNLANFNFKKNLEIDPDRYPVKANRLTWERIGGVAVQVSDLGPHSRNLLTRTFTKAFVPKVLIKAENPEFFKSISDTIIVDMVRAIPEEFILPDGTKRGYNTTKGSEVYLIEAKRVICGNLMILTPKNPNIIIDGGTYVLLNFKLIPTGPHSGFDGYFLTSRVSSQFITRTAAVGGSSSVLFEIASSSSNVFSYSPLAITQESRFSMRTQEPVLNKFGEGEVLLTKELKEKLQINDFPLGFYLLCAWGIDVNGNLRLNSSTNFFYDNRDESTATLAVSKGFFNLSILVY